MKSEGIILVQRDQEGKLSVSETGDQLGRKGMLGAWLGPCLRRCGRCAGAVVESS